jgi:type I restriction enzyme S subunit
MSRGRKTKSVSAEMNWQQIFNKNVGVYLQDIIIELGRSKQIGLDTSHELVSKIKAEKAILNSKETTLLPINSKEIPFEIPSNWQWCRLGELFHIERGSSPRPKGDLRYFSKIKTKYNWITISDMTAFAKDTPLSDTREFLTELGTKHSRYVTPKDIIVVASGSAGRSSLLGIDGYIYDGLMAVKNIQDDVMRNFLFYMFKVFQTSMMDVASGATWQNINTDILKNQLIPIPPLSEQSLILSFLNDFEFNRLKVSGFYFNKAVEQKIVKLHKSQLLVYENFSLMSDQLTQLENLNQAILQEAVQGKLVKQNPKDDPAVELLKRIKAEKLKSGKKEKPLPPINAAEIPFEIPESWVWCRLGDICSKIGSGSTPKGSNYSKSGFPFFRSQNIYNEGLVFTDITFVSEEVQKQMNGTVVFPNDILLNITGGSLGRCSLVPNDFEQGNVSQHVCIIRPLVVDRNFFHKLVLSPYFQKFVFSSTTGAGREGLPKYNLERFVIPLPPLSEQTHIVAEIEKQLAKTKQLKEYIIANQHATEQLLKALLHGAFDVEEKEEVHN